MSDKPKLPHYDPKNADTYDDKAAARALIAQLDIEALKKEWSQFDKEEWVPFETVLAELERLSGEHGRSH